MRLLAVALLATSLALALACKSMSDDPCDAGVEYVPQVDIQFLERRPDLLTLPDSADDVARLAITVALLEEERRRHRTSRTATPATARAADRPMSAWRALARRDALR